MSLRPDWWPDHRRTPEARAYLAERRQRHPLFVEAVLADARVHARNRGEPIGNDSRRAAVVEAVRLAVISDAFLGQVYYRARASMLRRGIPILPSVFHRMSMMTAQICIGDPVIVEAGVYINHGQVVIDGMTEIHTGVHVSPFVSIGLVAGSFNGPVIERNVRIGTGARLLGSFTVGQGAQIGANAVVLRDVPAQARMVGIPAKAMPDKG